MRTENNKTIRLAALAAAVILCAGCTDISTDIPEPETAVTVLSESEQPHSADTSEEPEDDDPIEAGFVTTGEEDEPAESSVSTAPAATESTTFPKQTGRSEVSESEEVLEAVVTTSETTAVTTVTAEEVTEQTTTSSAAVTAEEKPVNYNVIGENGILVSYQDGHYRGLMACFGTYALCERWSGAVNTFAEKLPGVNVYSMTVPIASEFYTPKKFWDSGFTVSQYNKCEHIKENLSGAVYVDAYTTLKEHTDENIYSRTDHHWTPLGAYYAAEQFAAAAGVDFPPLDDYKPVSRSGYVGSMYTYSKDYHLYNDAETFTMYLSPNVDSISTTYYNTSFGGAYAGDLFVSRNAASFYCSFIGSDDRITKVETDVKNGRTLVVFKQSYGNALIPFLTSGFEKIYVCDMRYFNLNGLKFCKDVGATDVLCTDCVMVAAGNGGTYLNALLGR